MNEANEVGVNCPSCGDDVKELDSLCNKCEESVKNFLDDSEERNRRVK